MTSSAQENIEVVQDIAGRFCISGVQDFAHDGPSPRLHEASKKPGNPQLQQEMQVRHAEVYSLTWKVTSQRALTTGQKVSPAAGCHNKACHGVSTWKPPSSSALRFRVVRLVWGLRVSQEGAESRSFGTETIGSALVHTKSTIGHPHGTHSIYAQTKPSLPQQQWYKPVEILQGSLSLALGKGKPCVNSQKILSHNKWSPRCRNEEEPF